MTNQKQREDRAYVVEGSEDGVIGVANSAVKAAMMALAYVTRSTPKAMGWTQDQRDRLAREIRSDGYASISTAELNGAVACSDNISAEVTSWGMNVRGGVRY